MSGGPHAYGVLAGRWQPLHRGHVWVIEQMLKEVERVVLAIVNPDPANPPDRSFDRFKGSVNPLSYWERYWILTRLAKELRAEDRMHFLPSGHPRVSIEPERYFLPPRRQSTWFVPFASDEEEQKASDFRDRGLHVRVIQRVPSHIQKFSAVAVRQQILARVPQWRAAVPESLLGACAEVGIDMEEKIKSGNSPTRAASNLARSVAVMPGWFAPPDRKHESRIRDTLGRFDIAHLAVMVAVNPCIEDGWPKGLGVNNRCPMTYWERYNALSQTVIENSWYDRVTVGPIFIGSRTLGMVEYEPFVPSPRTWMVDGGEEGCGALIAHLTQAGERVEDQRSDDAAARARSAVLAALRAGRPLPSEALAAGCGAYVHSLHLHARMATMVHHYERRSPNMGGMHFHGNVTVNGSIVNVEGHMHNLGTGDTASFRSVLDAIVRSSVPEESLLDAVSKVAALAEVARLPTETVRDVAEEVARDAAADPRLADRLKLLAGSLAVGTSGSLIASAIVKGIQAVLGG